MNHRVSVNHLNRTGIWQRVFDYAAHRLARSEGENRTQAFATVEQAVTHRFKQRGGRTFRLGDHLCERALDEGRSLFQIAIEIKHSGSSCPAPTAPLVGASAVRTVRP